MGQIIRLSHRDLNRFISSRPSSTSANKLYSDTLLLPKTSFPLRHSDPDENEAQLCLRTTKNLWDWQSKQLDRPPWTILDGPPYANGSLHMGHALNKILKDIVNRNKLLHGFRVNYIPGFDCHGLPLELKAIETAQAASSTITELDPVQVRNAARKTAAGGVDLQLEEFNRLSILTDWRNAWRTMDHNYEIKQLELFGQMVKNQLICRYRKPVHFSPSSGTALAEAEIEYRDDHLSRSVYVSFDVVHQSPILQATIQKLNISAKLRIVVWTTTPWTLVANQAVVVAKTARYSLVKRSVKDSDLDEILIFATNRLHILQDLLSDHPENFEIIAELSGEELASSTYTHDFTSTELPLFTADHVTVESGSGLVHTAPSHGLEDFYSYKTFMATHQPHQSVSYIDIVDDQGRFKCGDNEELEKRLNGKEVLQEGNHEVISMLHEQRRLIGKEVIIRHKYPYDWRTKKPILTKITSQWFVELADIRQKALSMLQQVEFYPKSSRTRLESFVKSRSEWCISRQRPWGVPIPVLYCLETDLPLLTDESVSWIIDILKVKGVGYWWDGPVADFIPPGVEGRYRKGVDTMDVWFDSGVSWWTLGGAQADMVLEGSDQHRGWFQSLLLTSIAANHHMENVSPIYRLVVTHGFTLDKHGRKMSKSLGNILSPLEIIDGNKSKKQPKFGIDVLRFWTASVDFAKDVTIGTDQLSRLSDIVRKIRSTARFLLGNVYRENDTRTSDIDYSGPQLGLIERHMLHLLHEYQRGVQLAYNELDFKQVVQLITRFTTNTLSAFYFGITKDILYNDSKGSTERQGVLFVMSQILNIYKLAIAPILPHLAEEISQHGTKRESRSGVSHPSVFEGNWPTLNDNWKDTKAADQMMPLLSIRDIILRELEILRQSKRIRTADEAELVVDLSGASGQTYDAVDALLEHSAILPRLFGLSDVSVCKTANATNTVLGLAAPSWKHSFQWKTEGRSGLTVKFFLLPAWRSKCPRCWKFAVEEGCDVCGRCAEVLTENLVIKD